MPEGIQVCFSAHHLSEEERVEVSRTDNALVQFTSLEDENLDLRTQFFPSLDQFLSNLLELWRVTGRDRKRQGYCSIPHLFFKQVSFWVLLPTSLGKDLLG